MKRYGVAMSIFLFVAPVLATTYHISPSGSDANSCASAQSASTPKKTFVSLFACGTAGDTFILMSTAAMTTYAAATTGNITYDDGSCTNCEQPPSGSSLSVMTIVKSTDTTKSIRVDSGSAGAGRYALFLGRSDRKDKFIKIEGITFIGGGALYNTEGNYIKTCGFYAIRQDGGGVFDIGTSDGNWGNKNNLVEDVWVWGKDRLIASNYRGTGNIWRRVVIRGDGCNTAACDGSGNPNVGITVYNSSSTSMQNVLILDRVLQGTNNEYADFATAQHDAGGVDLGAAEFNKLNEWLGCASINSSDNCLNFEADGATSPSVRIKDFACIHPDLGGLDIGTANVGVTMQNVTVLGASGTGHDGIRLAPGVTGGSVFNLVVATAARYGINSAVQPSHSSVHNAATADYNQTTCATGCLTTDPQGGATPPIKYPTRIETGSAFDGTGLNGADYGSNLVFQYGLTGTFDGQASSNTLTSTALWPWPNEDRIRTEMCSTVSTNWCAGSKKLTEYVWEYLGNTIPSDIYGGSDPAVTQTKAIARGALSIRGVTFR